MRLDSICCFSVLPLSPLGFFYDPTPITVVVKSSELDKHIGTLLAESVSIEKAPDGSLMMCGKTGVLGADGKPVKTRIDAEELFCPPRNDVILDIQSLNWLEPALRNNHLVQDIARNLGLTETLPEFFEIFGVSWVSGAISRKTWAEDSYARSVLTQYRKAHAFAVLAQQATASGKEFAFSLYNKACRVDLSRNELLDWLRSGKTPKIITDVFGDSGKKWSQRKPRFQRPVQPRGRGYNRGRGRGRATAFTQRKRSPSPRDKNSWSNEKKVKFQHK